jgi:hypothetical protein
MRPLVATLLAAFALQQLRVPRLRPLLAPRSDVPATAALAGTFHLGDTHSRHLLTRPSPWTQPVARYRLSQPLAPSAARC